MKKSLYPLILLSGAAMLFAGCANDNTETPAKARNLDLTVSYSLQGDATGLGAAWSSGDAGKLGIITGKGVVKSSKIEISGQTATFSADVMDNESEVYCFYPANDKATAESADFIIAASRTDATLGTALTGQFPLVSEAVALTRESKTATVEAKAVPAILRITVFSSESEFQSESVSAISINAAEKLNGTYNWNFTTATGAVVDGTNTSSVKFGTHYDLNGIASAKDAATVDLPVAPTALASGYEIRVSTQKATYVYKGTEKAFEMGTVYDIDIDLKSAVRNAKDIISFSAEGLKDIELDANGSADAATPEAVGKFTALVNGNESSDYTKDYYQALTFKVTDSEGNPATWLTPSVGDEGNIMMLWEINPKGEARTANIEATYTSADDVYYENPAFTFAVTQKETVVNYKINNLSKNYTLKATSKGFDGMDMGYFHAYVNCDIETGEKRPASEHQWYDLKFAYEDEEGNPIDWVNAYVKDDGDHLFIACSANTTPSSRKGLIKVYNPFNGKQFTTPDGKETLLVYTVEQKGLGEKSIVTYKWTQQFQGTIPGEGITDKDFGYYQAYIDGNNSAEASYSSYYNITYTYVDDNGAPVDWISVKRNAGDSNHPLVTCQPNTGGLRRATVLAHYASDEYTEAGDPIFSFTVIQGPAAGQKYVSYSWYGGAVKEARQSGYADWDLGYYQAFVDGSDANEYAANGNVYTPRYDITLTLEPAEAAEWLDIRVTYKDDLASNPALGGGNHIRCKMGKNETGAVREVTVKAHYNDSEYSTLDPIFSFVIRQVEK